MNEFTIPDLHEMSEDEVRQWIASLTTPMVLRYLGVISRAVSDRLGPDARISTSTFQPPKVVYLIEDAV